MAGHWSSPELNLRGTGHQGQHKELDESPSKLTGGEVQWWGQQICHTLDLRNKTEASICVPMMFKSHV
jgi:hypothetical protein